MYHHITALRCGALHVPVLLLHFCGRSKRAVSRLAHTLHHAAHRCNIIGTCCSLGLQLVDVAPPRHQEQSALAAQNNEWLWWLQQRQPYLLQQAHNGLLLLFGGSNSRFRGLALGLRQGGL